MGTTVGQEAILAEYTTSLAGVVCLTWRADTFRTEQQFDDGNAATIELPSALAAFLCYQYAREHGRIRAPFPVPVADEEPDPPEESAPVLMVAAEARGIRRRAHVTIRALAAEVSVSVSAIKEWEGKDCVLPLNAKRRARSAKYQRYVAALAELAVAYPPAEPEPQVVATAPDGKRRCRHAGCSTILSRFNEGDSCACHA